jgi:mannose-6-phosphate isomerase
MSDLPILKFEPILKPTVWGGRELARLFGRRLPGDGPFGESWELVDLPGEGSVVADGPLLGATLADLRRDRPEELLGPASLLEGRFPLLLKFIDARRTLSVQVHPDEAACARLGGGARPKTEAWYVIDREPGAALYVGLREGVDRALFEDGLSQGTLEDLLRRVPVEPGDFVHLPAGTVHAIGAGIVLAEVQQASDTTYRVFDWNRVGLDGKPRALHVAEALEAIDFAGEASASGSRASRVGVRCPEFAIDLVGQGEGAAEFSNLGPVALMGVSGTGRRTVRAAGEERPLVAGETLLIPASGSGEIELSTGDLGALVIMIGK